MARGAERGGGGAQAVRTAYKGYTIETETPRHAAGGWTALVQIYNPDGTPARSSLDLGRDVTFATEERADQAALLLGLAWVDRRRRRET